MASTAFHVWPYLCVQHDFGNQGIIGHHHGARAKQSFQIVGQLLPPRVTGVHRDETVGVWVQRQFRAFELKFRHPCSFRFLNLWWGAEDEVSTLCNTDTFVVDSVDFVDFVPSKFVAQ